LDVTSRTFGNVVVATPVGRADLAGSTALEAALSPLWAKPDMAGLVLDLGGVPYISSVGLRVLMIAAKQMRSRHARIAVTGLQPVVAEIFAISRFDKVLEVFPAVRDALAAIAPAALGAYDTASGAIP
jgi:anti-anti-sigma factor